MWQPAASFTITAQNQTLQTAKAMVYRTDLCGAISVEPGANVRTTTALHCSSAPR